MRCQRAYKVLDASANRVKYDLCFVAESVRARAVKTSDHRPCASSSRRIAFVVPSTQPGARIGGPEIERAGVSAHLRTLKDFRSAVAAGHGCKYKLCARSFYSLVGAIADTGGKLQTPLFGVYGWSPQHIVIIWDAYIYLVFYSQ